MPVDSWLLDKKELEYVFCQYYKGEKRTNTVKDLVTKSKEVEGYLFTVRGLVIIRRKSRKWKNKKKRDRQAIKIFRGVF